MENEQKSGVSGLTLLQLIFITLKLCNIIHWSWWWVLSPMWGMALLIVIVVVVALFFKR